MKYIISIFCMGLAIVITSQVKNYEEVEETVNTGALARAEALQISLIEEQTKNADLYEQLQVYRRELELYTQIASEAGGYTQILSEQLTQAQILGGLVDVYGEGIVITMTDSVVVNNYGFDENNFLIHDEDILRVINELRDAGAEAISINGERILSTSEIRCSGSTVSVNNKKYSAPYVIQAIGSAKELEGALTMRRGVVDILSEWGIEVVIEQSENIKINAYDGVITQKYAKIEN